MKLGGLLKNLVYHSDFCDQHVKPVQKMVINNQVVCPRCESEKSTKKLEKETTAYFEQMELDRKYSNLKTKSIIEDETLIDARLENFTEKCEEEKVNKATVLECLERFKQGEVFNLVLQGKQGTGKSHLAYSALWELNETKKYSCLFVSVDAMIRKIKNSFNDKGNMYTEEYFNRLLSEANYLVLDDLGAETGAINTDKAATDFVQRVLYGVTNSRQNKVTILTTNLSSESLYSMYDKKLVSRLMKRPKVVMFKESKDKRISNLPF